VNAKGKITVLLAEDHLIVRQGLCALLDLEEQFAIVGEAQTGSDAVDLAKSLRPDVIVMDIAMPVMNGLEATRQILAAIPTAKVLILSGHTDDEYIERMTTAGARGFLEKQTSAQVLAEAVREVAKGNTFYSPGIAKRLREAAGRPRDRAGLIVAKGKPLTRREREVLQLVAEGASNKQVASRLKISIKTVEKHRQHLMNKLNIHDTATLTRYAIGSGVIESNVQLTIS
jgi:DNA-binding NarL/FixJ family response regulator